MKEDVVIVSLDESNFRCDSFRRYKWKFTPKLGTVSKVLESKVLEVEAGLEPVIGMGTKKEVVVEKLSNIEEQVDSTLVTFLSKPTE